MTTTKSIKRVKRPRIELGWAELVDLPDLDFFDLHAKVDTGARTSSLHATHIRIKANGGRPRVSFRVRWGKGAKVGSFDMPLHANRRVTSSNGAVEDRPVIQTNVTLGGITQLVEITLTHRGTMAFPMLVGRSALRRHYIVNCARKFVTRAATQAHTDAH